MEFTDIWTTKFGAWKPYMIEKSKGGFDDEDLLANGWSVNGCAYDTSIVRSALLAMRGQSLFCHGCHASHSAIDWLEKGNEDGSTDCIPCGVNQPMCPSCEEPVSSVFCPCDTVHNLENECSLWNPRKVVTDGAYQSSVGHLRGGSIWVPPGMASMRTRLNKYFIGPNADDNMVIPHPLDSAWEYLKDFDDNVVPNIFIGEGIYEANWRPGKPLVLNHSVWTDNFLSDRETDEPNLENVEKLIQYYKNFSAARKAPKDVKLSLTFNGHDLGETAEDTPSGVDRLENYVRRNYGGFNGN